MLFKNQPSNPTQSMPCMAFVPRVNWWWTIPTLLVCAMGGWVPKAEAQAARISLTIDSVNNHGCFDQFIFCTRPDMMVRVTLRGSDGSLTQCPDTVPIANRDNIGPLASCNGQLVETPVDLIVTIFDVDEGKLPGTVSIQSEVRLSESGSGATLPWFRLNSTQTIKGSQADITLSPVIMFVNPAFGSSTLSLSQSTIDPTLFGERTIASGTILTAETPAVPYPGGTRVRFSVQSPTGEITILGEGVNRGRFNLDWDGRINGKIVPPGIYQLRTTLVLSGATITAPVTITGITNVFDIQRSSPDPWNARAGPAFFSYRMSPRGKIAQRVEGPSAAGSACTLAPQPIVVPEFTVGPLNAGNGTLSVPMTTPARRFLPPGNYCVKFRATDEAGNLIGTRDVEFNVSAPPLRLVAALNPSVPWILPLSTAFDALGNQVLVPAGPVFVEVRALDDQGQARPTGRITVRAVPFLTIPVPSGFITTQTCAGVSICRMQIGMPTLTRSPQVIFDAEAADETPINSNDAPSLTASVPQRAATLVWAPQDRAGPVSVPVTGSIAKGFDTVPRNRTQDVAFHVGTGLNLAVPAEATQVSDGIATILNVFFGGDPAVGATSVTEDLGQSIAFWMTRKPAIVDAESSSPGAPGAPVCRRSRLESVPFADMQAVIHAVNCRDTADWNGHTFSAEWDEELGRVFWHEFHHAAYDLADEYEPDGAYYQTGTLPNVMSSVQECHVHGAEPKLCAQIGTTGWWRAAPNPDVMVENTRENLDDLRRARMIQGKCSTGGC